MDKPKISVSSYLRDMGIKQILKMRGNNIRSAIRHIKTRCKIPKGKNLSHVTELFRNVLNNCKDIFPEEQLVIELLKQKFGGNK